MKIQKILKTSIITFIGMLFGCMNMLNVQMNHFLWSCILFTICFVIIYYLVNSEMKNTQSHIVRETNKQNGG